MTKVNINRDWEAEADADTLARALEIQEDKTRMSRAMKIAKKRANEMQKRASSMARVANGKKKK